MPGARSLWIVTMKFRPVKIDEKPRMNAANVISPTRCRSSWCEYGV